MSSRVFWQTNYLASRLDTDYFLSQFLSQRFTLSFVFQKSHYLLCLIFSFSVTLLKFICPTFDIDTVCIVRTAVILIHSKLCYAVSAYCVGFSSLVHQDKNVKRSTSRKEMIYFKRAIKSSSS